MSTIIGKIEHIENAHFHYPAKERPLPSNIPSSKGFVGREAELAVLRDARAGGRTSFVLHGQGGVGKTGLALEFIKEIKGEYQAHVRIDMQGLAAEPLQARDAKLQIVRAFEPDLPVNFEEAEINSLFISLMKQHKTILLLDNAKERAQVEPLNQTEAFVVITSRASFNVTDGFGKLIEQMSPEDARKLLYSITDEKRFAGNVDAIAYLAGYLPMAMLPLASILTEDVTEDIENLLGKYADRKKRLHLQDPNQENLSVAASFDLSYELLSDGLKERWRKLAVFPAGFDLKAMEAVCNIADGQEDRSILIRQSLLLYNTETKRSRLHDLARDYANEKLSDKERIEAQLSHCSYFLSLFVGFENDFATFDRERINIEHGFAWLRDRLDLADNSYNIALLCDGYLGILEKILLSRLNFRQHIDWLETSLRASRQAGEQQLEGHALSRLGMAYSRLGAYQKAIEYHEMGLKIARDTGDKFTEAYRLTDIGVAYADSALSSKAIDHYSQALAISRNIRSQDLERMILMYLGNVYDFEGDNSSAIQCREEAMALSKKLGIRQGEVDALRGLGSSKSKSGEHETAVELYEKASQLSKDIGYEKGEMHSLADLGEIYAKTGERNKQIECYQQALLISRKAEDPERESLFLSRLGSTYESLGDLTKALEYWEQSLRIAKEIGDENRAGQVLGHLGDCFLNLSDVKKAIGYYKEALIITEELGDHYFKATRLSKLGIAYSFINDKAKAMECYQESLRIFEGLDSSGVEIVERLMLQLKNAG